ncbi:MAG: hypothetical protein R2838_04345 [Caldilineaceae bacterium]
MDDGRSTDGQGRTSTRNTVIIMTSKAEVVKRVAGLHDTRVRRRGLCRGRAQQAAQTALPSRVPQPIDETIVFEGLK